MAVAFPGLRMQIEEDSNPTLVIEPMFPEFGPLEIIDDGDELTVMAGNFTHGHFSCYDDGLSVEEKAEEIADRTVEFLKDVFSDKVIFWCRPNHSGGWYTVEDAEGGLQPRYGENQAVWSGYIRAGG